MKIKYLLGLLFLASCTTRPEPPKAVLPVPTARQMAGQELEYYAFIHFNMNTCYEQKAPKKLMTRMLLLLKLIS